MDPRQLAEHLRFYQELGVAGISRDAAWRRREGGDAGATPNAELQTSGADVHAAGVPPEAQERRVWTLDAIRDDIGDCTRCKLHGLGRRQIVFGVGNPQAELMFVGEGPGADEDVQGIPFVGRAGQLLTKMIEAMGFRREDVYIANVVKCRPPENRNPEPDEIASCEPFLFRQIEAIRPKVIVALGSFAAKTLLRTQDPISRLRGRVYDYHGAKLIPTFHPSFLLRSPNQKKYAWEDLKTALAVLGRAVPSGSTAGQ
ncbi:MAG TPA: uracil-DNA glycosylase [Vicinamibacterales bacterium]|nr:uracil-DNA glycosylase [Vicinamibacterales bacterium]